MGVSSNLQWGCSPESVFNIATREIIYGPSDQVGGFGVPWDAARTLWPANAANPNTVKGLSWEDAFGTSNQAQRPDQQLPRHAGKLGLNIADIPPVIEDMVRLGDRAWAYPKAIKQFGEGDDIFGDDYEKFQRIMKEEIAKARATLNAVQRDVYTNFGKTLDALTNSLAEDRVGGIAYKDSISQNFDRVWRRGVTQDTATCAIFTNSAQPALQADVAMSLVEAYKKYTNPPKWVRNNPILRKMKPSSVSSPWHNVTGLMAGREDLRSKLGTCRLASTWFNLLSKSDKNKIILAVMRDPLPSEGRDVNIGSTGQLKLFYTLSLLITCDAISLDDSDLARPLVTTFLTSVQAHVDAAIAKTTAAASSLKLPTSTPSDLFAAGVRPFTPAAGLLLSTPTDTTPGSNLKIPIPALPTPGSNFQIPIRGTRTLPRGSSESRDDTSRTLAEQETPADAPAAPADAPAAPADAPAAPADAPAAPADAPAAAPAAEPTPKPAKSNTWVWVAVAAAAIGVGAVVVMRNNKKRR
jgi:hypothetical protein